MSANEKKIWYYASWNNERLGPISLGELAKLAETGVVLPKTLVWSEGYPEWIPAEKIADLLTSAQVRDVAAPAPAEAPTVQPPAPSPAVEIKPLKGPFVFPRLLLAFFLSLMAGGVAAVFLLGSGNPPWPGLLVLILGTALGAWAGGAAYRKEAYQIDDTRVICRRGGLVSDQTTELEIRRITHVKLKLPWLAFKFLGAGNVIVETAGTSKPVVLRGIPEPEKVYADLRGRMRKNGYDLTQQQLLHEARPAIIAIIGECVGLATGAIFIGSVLIAALTDKTTTLTVSSTEVVVPIVAGVIGLGFVIFATLRFMDFRRRTYRVYNDVVVYDEGFLTRENAFIPYENIADSNTKCSFFDRLFGLYDVQVSCQGSGAEIKFRRLRNGIALSAAIDELVVRARQKVVEKKTPSPETASSRSVSRRAEPEAVPFDETWVAELQMSPARTLLPLLVIFPLIPVWIAATIRAVILLVSTRYSVRHGSLRHSFRALTVHDREFACEKITGVVIKQNPWDRLFGTFTLKFWSIGSGRSLVFAHVKSSQVNLPALMRQVGIPPASKDCYEAKPSFGAVAWLREHFRQIPLVLLSAATMVAAGAVVDPIYYALLALPALLAIGSFIHAKLYYARESLSFHEHHVEAEQGVIFKSRYHVRYKNVKRLKATRYPWGEDGRLQITAAAEEEIQQAATQQQANKYTTIHKPCAFTTGMLADVSGTGLLLDEILGGKIEPSAQSVFPEPPAVIVESPRSIGGGLVRLIFVSIVIFPLILVLPISIPAAIVWIKRWRYRIEENRIVIRQGIFFRSETSVLLDRVDSLKQSQGPLNKLFGNGNVSIMTAGSSKSDLVLVDAPGYLALYQEVRRFSEETTPQG